MAFDPAFGKNEAGDASGAATSVGAGATSAAARHAGAGATSAGAATVRAASAADAEALHEVAASTFALACPPDTTQQSIDDFIATHLSVERFADYLSDPDRELFIAEVDGAPAGYTMLVFGEPSDADVAAAVTARPTAELSKVYVLAEHHGAGIAGALVEATVASAVRAGVASVWLGVNQLNAKANRFYEKHGFARVGTKKFLVGDRWEDDFVRERSL